MAEKDQTCEICLGTGTAKTVFQTNTICPACKGTGRKTSTEGKK